jgi:hypothetical protein
VKDLDVPGIERTMDGASLVSGSRNTRRVAAILLHTRRPSMRVDWLGQESDMSDRKSRLKRRCARSTVSRQRARALGAVMALGVVQ